MRYLEMYTPYKINVKSAEGIYIYDINGNKYIDTFSGIGVMALGHTNKKVNEAIIKKLKKHSHLSNFFLDENTEEVAELLTDKDEKVFFTNSGTESMEFALKTVKKIIGDSKILYFSNSFHGRTLGALSVNGFENLTKPFKPLLPNTIKCEFNNLEELKNIFSKIKDIKAIVFEVIQGSGGIKLIDRDFIDLIREYSLKNNSILIADEIQSGLYRTGYKYAFEEFDVEPDIITLAKALGGGIPLGAVVMKDKIAKHLEKGDHGSTFAPNPLAIAASKIVLEELQKINGEINEKGTYLIKKLETIKSDKIKEIRGKGLMVGIELKESDEGLIEKGIKNGLLINVLQNKVIRLLPALNITYSEIDKIVERLRCIL
ncbi:aspartate aminotransferase family protein [Geotoga petraea]|jgi:acetylornithine/N-succinyldiaminopimelate aminotransferase|uniref:Acetylornithine/succinyldiaminopimelate/putrescine aminotransferase n=1 Tax=Geotoga petraea TaxID=28234 RepID=A0A1G6MX80_9BACT|nr:aminotransferase class III-fold pyridoxal phosphate-dependent enzyme [Geotoga petraea]SDC60153.1 Acetylornithine/succinyldiaminopimelate/putrescine aminotransferase [Geotoga petraea]